MDESQVPTNQNTDQQAQSQQPLEDNPPSDNAPESGPKSKKLWIILAAVAVVLLAAAAWFLFLKPDSGDKDAKAGTYQGKIVIGYTAWPGYVGLYLARDKGYFEARGMDVELRIYDSFGELSDAYTSGQIQGKANLGLDAVSEAYGGLDHKVVAVIDQSNGSDGIIGSADITSLKQLKGKKVAFEHNALDDFFTRYALEQNDMTIEDIEPVNLNAEDSAKALVDGEVAAAATYEPFMTTALNEAKGHLLYSSADAPGLISDLLTFRADFVDAYPNTVQALVDANLEGVAFWKSNPDEANKLIAKELKVSVEEAVEQLKGITVLDKEDNLTAFTFSAGLKSIYGNLRTVNDFFKTQDIAKGKTVNTDDLVDPRFVRGLLD
jgi:NitT/TauT family transport system substrate-binding protein